MEMRHRGSGWIVSSGSVRSKNCQLALERRLNAKLPYRLVRESRNDDPSLELLANDKPFSIPSLDLQGETELWAKVINFYETRAPGVVSTRQLQPAGGNRLLQAAR